MFTLKTGTNRIRIALRKDGNILFQREIMIGTWSFFTTFALNHTQHNIISNTRTMKRYFREHCLLELRHVSRPTDIVSFEIEEFNVERVGSPIPKQVLSRSSVIDSHKVLDVNHWERESYKV